MVEDGYEFFAKRRLVTLFSAPNYCGEFTNAGAMMSVDEALMCSFQASPAHRHILAQSSVMYIFSTFTRLIKYPHSPYLALSDALFSIFTALFSAFTALFSTFNRLI